MPLDALISEATRYAQVTMKRSGMLAPVMLAAAEQGMILFSPEQLSDTGAKDDFANKVRLITASYGATSVVLIVESWVTRARKDEPLDVNTPPSESLEREEMVVLIAEGQGGVHRTLMLPIHRLDNGKFWNLGDAVEMGADTFSGRFAGLLPPKSADEKTRAMGKVLLKAMAVKLTALEKR
jgi:hypothetical protein